MKCPKCQSENPEGVKFCGRCGTRLQLALSCPQCSHSNPPDVLFCHECGHSLDQSAPQSAQPPTITPTAPLPTSFANGRYQVKKFLGEGGKKKVYLAHDTALDRDVAFALIKTEKLDESARTRIKREAQAMGKLGDHPNIVSIFDIGDHQGQPYIVIPFMPGGDVEGLVKKATDHKLPLDKATDIAKAVCRGLEFAHAKGIIHRDIKPGNIWLNAEGIAQIGDFGLAVAVDLSRLTGVGMMVGTVSYMPPEQAMGGEVTAKADLYSLGAMLYEMVTGRPPFIGDESVAIIGQHINTPPVSPTWHRADLPPSLETLIMQLLEKDPEKRPQSAKVVLDALESIGKGKTEAETVGLPAAPTENPLYRRVFVGREPELKALQAAFDGAVSGQGSLIMVVGEPGIGKTALTDQLATYVTLRGGKTLVGHCYEEGSLSLPYLPFVEAMRSYVLDREPDDLRREMGSGASDIARIVSEVRDKLRVEPPLSQSPDEERYRLMQAVASFLTNAAAIKPLFVLLEDLHDADKGTLDMLTHISRNLVKTRLVVVGTYRDVEVDRSHPLSGVLAELRRASHFGRILLRGLNAGEVGRMLSSITHSTIPPGLAETVHRQTEGNPLFVQEVVRFLAEEGLMTQRDGRWKPASGTALEMSIPEGLRDVIGKRLSLLSTECNELLSTASVIGREFTLDVLRAVDSVEETVFMRALKEAVQLSVLEERPQVGSVRYRFTHAFFRQTLYEEMIAPQRLKLHQQVARALERQYAKRLDEHAAELAEHFSQSTDPADLEKAVHYSGMAAKRAGSVYAYGEGVRHMEQALKVQRVLDPDDKARQCDLLLGLGDALADAGEPERAFSVVLSEAFTLAEALGDRARASRACVLATTSLGYHGATSLAIWNSPAAGQWADRSDRYAEPESPARVWADLCIGATRWAVATLNRDWDGIEAGAELIRQAVGLARRLGDSTTYWAMAYLALYRMNTPQEKLALASEMANLPRHGIPVKTLGVALLFIGNAFLESGERKRAEKAYDEVKQLAERTGQGNLLLLSPIVDAIRAILDGRLQDVEAANHSMIELGEQLGLAEYARVSVGWTYHRCQLLLGDAHGALKMEVGLPVWRILSLARAGQEAEARKALEQWVASRPGFGTSRDTANFAPDFTYLETAVLVKHKAIAGRLLERLGNGKWRYISNFSWTCPDRILGGAAAFLGQHERARAFYAQALEAAAEIGARPELALTRLELAELLLEHYPDEKKDALEHLDFAIKEFREMKMQPSLERALRHKEILKA